MMLNRNYLLIFICLLVSDFLQESVCAIRYHLRIRYKFHQNLLPD